MEYEILSSGLERKVSKDELKNFFKIRGIVTQANLPASARKIDINIARRQFFSFDQVLTCCNEANNQVSSN